MPRKDSGQSEERISFAEGKRRLEQLIQRGNELSSTLPINEPDFQTWSTTAFEVIGKIWGRDSDHVGTFAGQPHWDASIDSHVYPPSPMQLRNRIKVLKALLRLVEDEITLETHHEGQPSEFWSDLHQDVVRVSKELFKDCHYAEAVEAAFKELNRKVKQHVREKTGQDLDGADLMHQAFTTKNRAPIITLADLSTEDGRSIQQGYMEIFAGAMTGIRNPKAHSNIKIDQNRALHFLYLASLLHQIFDERL